RAGGHLDVVERVDVVIETGRADGRRVADVDAVQKRRVLCAGRAAHAEGALQPSGGAAHVRPADHQTRDLGLDQRPDVAAAGRVLDQLLAQVDVDVRAGRVDGGGRTRHRDVFGDRRHLHLEIDGRRLADEHDDVRALDRLEPGELQLDRIGAGDER